MKIQRTHKIKLNLTEEQGVFFLESARATRFAYNWGLARYNTLHDAGEKPSLMAIKKEFNAWKKEQYANGDLLWYKAVSQGRCTEWGIRTRLAIAFRIYFETRKGKRPQPKRKKPRKDGRWGAWPRFKSYKNPSQSFYHPAVELVFEGNWVKVPKVGWINMAEVLRFGGKVGNCVFTTKSGGRDWGLETKAVMWDGETAVKLNFPNFSNKSANKLAKLQRKLARQEEGSNRWKKTKSKIQDLHTKVANQRNWGTHQITNRIVEDAEIVFFEDLNVRGMSSRKVGLGKRGKGFNRAVLNANFGVMVEQTRYKVESQGGCVVKTPRFSPTSKVCSNCGTKVELSLNDRSWVCQGCRQVKDRDVNAAINIRNLGLEMVGNEG